MNQCGGDGSSFLRRDGTSSRMSRFTRFGRRRAGFIGENGVGRGTIWMAIAVVEGWTGLVRGIDLCDCGHCLASLTTSKMLVAMRDGHY